MNLQQIIDRRSGLQSEVAAIETAHPDFDYPADVQARLAAIDSEATALNAAERRTALFADRALAAPGKPLSSAAQPELRVFDGGLSARPEDFDGRILRNQSGDLVPLIEHRHRLASFLAPEQRSEVGIGEFLRAVYFGPRNEIERRALAEGSIGSGGAMVPTPLSATVIDALIAQSVSMRAGATVVPITSATQKFARVLTLPTGSFRTENSPITEDAPSFDALTLTAKTWALLVRCSRELLEDGQNTSATIQNVIGQAGALALDTAVLTGPGGTSPTGITHTAGVQSIPAGGAFTDWTKVLDAVEKLEEANSPTVSAIVYAPRTGRAVAGLKDTTNQPLMIPPKLAGIPQYSTTSIPINGGAGTNETSVILGNWGSVLIGLRVQLQVSTLVERYSDLGQIGFIAWLRMDVAISHPPAMAMVVGVTP